MNDLGPSACAPLYLHHQGTRPIAVGLALPGVLHKAVPHGQQSAQLPARSCLSGAVSALPTSACRGPAAQRAPARHVASAAVQPWHSGSLGAGCTRVRHAPGAAQAHRSSRAATRMGAHLGVQMACTPLWKHSCCSSFRRGRLPGSPPTSNTSRRPPQLQAAGAVSAQQKSACEEARRPAGPAD